MKEARPLPTPGMNHCSPIPTSYYRKKCCILEFTADRLRFVLFRTFSLSVIRKVHFRRILRPHLPPCQAVIRDCLSYGCSSLRLRGQCYASETRCATYLLLVLLYYCSSDSPGPDSQISSKNIRLHTSRHHIRQITSELLGPSCCLSVNSKLDSPMYLVYQTYIRATFLSTRP